MNIDLSGRRALVTGGSEGIGKAIAARLAASGAAVTIIARDQGKLDRCVEEIARSGQKIEAVSCDITDEAALRDSVGRLVAAGPIDILVNNAGSSRRMPLPQLSRGEIVADMELKLFAAVDLANLVTPAMKERRWGRIVNVVSVNGKAPDGGSAPTTLSRAAGMSLTKVMSRELAPHNILVNAICIGVIKSGQWERRHAAAGGEGGLEAFMGPQAERIPLGRVGEAEEVGNLACFLVSDQASYVTGTAINIDGGLCPIL